MNGNNTKITKGEEYGDGRDNYSTENDAYITEQYVGLNMIEHNLECIEIYKIRWSDWLVTFNRPLTYLEQLGILKIADADSIEEKGNNQYALWWD